jgi:hypothetical protein
MINLELGFTSAGNVCWKEYIVLHHTTLFNAFKKYISRPYDLDVMHCNLSISNSPGLGNFHMLRPYHWSVVWTAFSDREISGSFSRKFKRYLCRRFIAVFRLKNLYATISWCFTSLRCVRRVWHTISPHPGRGVLSSEADLLSETKYFIQVFRVSMTENVYPIVPFLI